MKKMKASILATVLLAFPLFSYAAPVTKTTDVEVGIQGGDITLDAPVVGKAFDTIKIDGTVQHTGAVLEELTITDLTGTGSGWRLAVQATPFSYTTAGSETFSLPKDSLQLQIPDRIVNVNNTIAPKISQAGAFTIDSDSQKNLLEAQKDEGMGEFQVFFFNATKNEPTLTLAVDTNKAKIDKSIGSTGFTPYKSTITWSLIQAP